ncbi:MAG TPA: amino acid ABC transporter permease [Nocardioidaceae bacterium]|jgi:polar amino acid transport system permease protein
MGDFAQYLPPLIRGAGLTLFLVVVSGAIGTLLGLLFGMARISPIPPVRWVAAVYVNFLRGQPALVILLFGYFAIPLLFPALAFSRGFTAIAGLSIYASAYIAEIFRGSIEAIPRGQTEASKALGMSYYHRFRYIILPQAMKIAVPPGIGFLISLVKASALVSVIGFVELTRAGKIVSTINQEPLFTFLVVAGIYFILSYPISLLGRWYERRLA